MATSPISGHDFSDSTLKFDPLHALGSLARRCNYFAKRRRTLQAWYAGLRPLHDQLHASILLLPGLPLGAAGSDKYVQPPGEALAPSGRSDSLPWTCWACNGRVLDYIDLRADADLLPASISKPSHRLAVCSWPLQHVGYEASSDGMSDDSMDREECPAGPGLLHTVVGLPSD